MWCLWAGLVGKVVERGGVDSWGWLEGVVGRIIVEGVVDGWGRGRDGGDNGNVYGFLGHGGARWWSRSRYGKLITCNRLASSVPLVALKSSYSSFVVSCLNLGVTKPTPSAMLR